MTIMTRKTAVYLALVALLACFAGIALFDHHEATVAANRAAIAQADAFYFRQWPDASGAMRKMIDYRGKPLVVNFWATWCVPCVQEIPALSKAHADAGGRVAFVGLGIDTPSNVAGFTERFRPGYPLLAAGADGTTLARTLGDEDGVLPFTVVLGPDGRIVARHLGKVDDATLKGWLAPYLVTGG